MTPAHTEPSAPETPSQVEMMAHSTDGETEVQGGGEPFSPEAAQPVMLDPMLCHTQSPCRERRKARHNKKKKKKPPKTLNPPKGGWEPRPGLKKELHTQGPV